MEFDEELEAVPFNIECDADDFWTEKPSVVRSPEEGDNKKNDFKTRPDNDDKIDEADPEMDDEFDCLFTQIEDPQEETKSYAAAGLSEAKQNLPKYQTPTPQLQNQINSKKRPNSLTTEETLPFFLTQENSSSEPPAKRNFPGPAGALPTLQNGKFRFSKDMNSNPSQVPMIRKLSAPTETGRKLTSEDSFAKAEEQLLNKAPWKSLSQTLNLNLKDKSNLLNTVNIKWAKDVASSLSSEDFKIPFLALVVTGQLEAAVSGKFKNRTKNPVARCMDPSGAVVAAFNHPFVDTFAAMIQPGTALALRGCTFTRVGGTIVLNVRKKNLACLATSLEIEPPESSQGRTPKLTFDKERKVYVLEMSPIVDSDILKDHSDIVERVNSISSSKNHENSRGHSNLPNESNRGPIYTSVRTSVPTGRGPAFGQYIPVRPAASAPPPVVTHYHVPAKQTVVAKDVSEFNDDDDEFFQALDLDILEEEF